MEKDRKLQVEIQYELKRKVENAEDMKIPIPAYVQAQTSETGRSNYDGVLETIESLPSFLGDYYNRQVGGKISDIAFDYKKYPGMFSNVFVENAKQSIASYFYTNQTLTQSQHSTRVNQKMYMLYVAECQLENVHAYVTDSWIQIMGLEHKKSQYVPPCVSSSAVGVAPAGATAPGGN